MPESIGKTFNVLGLKNKDISIKNIINTNLLKPGTKINKAEIVFKKIESD